eukprot:SAG11_NODE_2263_length_3607_cov_3.882839_2_plen_245_part_00
MCHILFCIYRRGRWSHKNGWLLPPHRRLFLKEEAVDRVEHLEERLNELQAGQLRRMNKLAEVNAGATSQAKSAKLRRRLDAESKRDAAAVKCASALASDLRRVVEFVDSVNDPAPIGTDSDSSSEDGDSSDVFNDDLDDDIDDASKTSEETRRLLADELDDGGDDTDRSDSKSDGSDEHDKIEDVMMATGCDRARCLASDPPPILFFTDTTAAGFSGDSTRAFAGQRLGRRIDRRPVARAGRQW